VQSKPSKRLFEKVILRSVATKNLAAKAAIPARFLALLGMTAPIMAFQTASNKGQMTTIYREINHDLCLNNSTTLQIARTDKRRPETDASAWLGVKLLIVLELPNRGKTLHPGAEEEVRAIAIQR
jgi:hypothetical protein